MKPIKISKNFGIGVPSYNNSFRAV